MGRKSKFNKDLCNDLCTYREEGLPLNDCANLCGLHPNTVSNWLKKGENSKTGKHHDFFIQWKIATSKFKRLHQNKIAGNKDWRASQYLLQVTDPQQYVVEEKTKVSADVKHDTNLSEFAKVLKESLENVQD